MANWWYCCLLLSLLMNAGRSLGATISYPFIQINEVLQQGDFSVPPTQMDETSADRLRGVSEDDVAKIETLSRAVLRLTQIFTQYLSIQVNTTGIGSNLLVAEKEESHLELLKTEVRCNKTAEKLKQESNENKFLKFELDQLKNITDQGLCPKPFKLWVTQCLYSPNTTRDWGSARTSCKELGGDLAMAKRNQHTIHIFIKKYYAGGLDDFWLGGSDVADEGRWTWLDGRPIDTSDFHPSKINRGEAYNCLALDRNKNPPYWEGRCEVNNRRYVCEIQM